MTQLLQDSLYNPLTKADWERFWGFCNLSHLSLEYQRLIKKTLQKATDKHPYFRRLIREHDAPFHFTFSADDREQMEKGGSAAFHMPLQNRISANLNNINEHFAGYILHEIRHRQQEKEGEIYFYNAVNSKLNAFIVRKLSEAEAKNIDSENSQRGFYFARLKKYHVAKLRETLQESDIPYAPNLNSHQKKEARKLYIDTKAFELAAGEAITLLMQPEGFKTALVSAENGLALTASELCRIDYGWRNAYNECARQASYMAILAKESGDEAQHESEEIEFKNRMEKYIPSLKGKNYFQPGLTSDRFYSLGLLFDEDIFRPTIGITYFEGTRIKATETIKKGRGYTISVFNKAGIKIYDGRYNEDGIRSGAENWYDDSGCPIVKRFFIKGILVGRSIYSNPKNGIRTEQKWVRGKCVEMLKFNKNNILIERITAEDVYDPRVKQFIEKYKNGQLVCSYHKWMEQNIGDCWRIRNGQKISMTYELIEDVDVPVPVSGLIEDIETERTRAIWQPYAVNPELVMMTLFNPDGTFHASGFALSKNLIPIGSWQVYNSEKHVMEEVFYTGRKIEHPYQWNIVEKALEKLGYVPVELDEYRKDVTGQNGVTDSIWLHQQTGLFHNKGRFDARGKEIGVSMDYRFDGTLRATSDLNEGYVSSVIYDTDGKTPTQQQVNYNDGRERTIFYYGDGESISSECDDKSEDLFEEKDFYLNGNLNNVRNNVYSRSYTPRGQLISETQTIDENGKLKKIGVTYYIARENEPFSNENLQIKMRYTMDDVGVRGTVYRRDNTVIREWTYVYTQGGTETIFGPDGSIRAQGAIDEKHMRTGQWIYPGRGIKIYQNGQEIMRSFGENVSYAPTRIITSASSEIQNMQMKKKKSHQNGN